MKDTQPEGIMPTGIFCPQSERKTIMENERNELVFTSMKELNKYLKSIDGSTMVSITVEPAGQSEKEGDEDNGR